MANMIFLSILNSIVTARDAWRYVPMLVTSRRVVSLGFWVTFTWNLAPPVSVEINDVVRDDAVAVTVRSPGSIILLALVVRSSVIACLIDGHIASATAGVMLPIIVLGRAMCEKRYAV